MIKRASLLRGAILVGLVLLIPSSTLAGGIGLSIPFYTLNLTETLGRVPIAVDEALGALGVPEADADEIVAELEAVLLDFPGFLPVPLLGGSIEFSLPFVLIDGLRLSGGFLNDQILRGAAGLFGLAVPQPLIDEEFESNGFEASVTADLSFSTFMLATEIVKRLDLLIAGINLGLGVDLIQGEITPAVDIDAADYQEEVDAALAELHLNEIYWTVFAVHGALGIEVGPPFLRTRAEVRFLLPLSRTTGWWEIDVGGLSGSVGLVIRF